LSFAGIYLNRRRDQYLVCTVDQGLATAVLGAKSAVEFLDWLSESHPRCLAIAGPTQLGKGMLSDPTNRARHGFNARGKSWSNWRVCEAVLRGRGMNLRRTPELDENVPGWLARTLQLKEKLHWLGYGVTTEEDSLKLIEVNPYAGFATMLKRNPLSRNSLEGRLQRQLVLYLEGLDLYNPLDVLEEITRFHLLQGSIPQEGLHTAEQLDCLCAAFTAQMLMTQPDKILQVGDVEDGLITLPVTALLDRYS
jgi:hypothetical protein